MRNTFGIRIFWEISKLKFGPSGGLGSGCYFLGQRNPFVWSRKLAEITFDISSPRHFVSKPSTILRTTISEQTLEREKKNANVRARRESGNSISRRGAKKNCDLFKANLRIIG